MSKSRWHFAGTLLTLVCEPNLSFAKELSYLASPSAYVWCVWAQPADAVQLPKDSLAKLSAMGYRTGRSIVRQVVQAPDGTCKFLLQLFDGRIIETVGIPDLQDTRLTVCVSSQVIHALYIGSVCAPHATGVGW